LQKNEEKQNNQIREKKKLLVERDQNKSKRLESVQKQYSMEKNKQRQKINALKKNGHENQKQEQIHFTEPTDIIPKIKTEVSTSTSTGIVWIAWILWSAE